MIWLVIKAPSASTEYQVCVSVVRPVGHVQFRSDLDSAPFSAFCGKASVTA